MNQARSHKLAPPPTVSPPPPLLQPTSPSQPPPSKRSRTAASSSSSSGSCPRLFALLASLFGTATNSSKSNSFLESNKINTTTITPTTNNNSQQQQQQQQQHALTLEIPSLQPHHPHAARLSPSPSPPTTPPNTTIIFPNLDSAGIGMARNLTASPLFAQASATVDYDILSVCLHGPQDKLASPPVAALAVYVSSLAAVARLKETQPHLVESVVAVAGLGVGEYAALTYAGVLSFDDGVALVNEAYSFTPPTTLHSPDTSPKHGTPSKPPAAAFLKCGMLSVVGLDTQAVKQIVADTANVHLSAHLFPNGVMLSGEVGALREAQKMASSRGASKVHMLPVDGGFHSPLMADVAPRLSKALAATSLKTLKDDTSIRVFSNVTGGMHNLHDAKSVKALLLRQLTEPLQWESILRALCDPENDLATAVAAARGASLTATNSVATTINPTAAASPSMLCPAPPSPPRLLSNGTTAYTATTTTCGNGSVVGGQLVVVSHTPHIQTMLRRANARAWRTRGVAVDV
ncbi:malonyl-CoA-acyl carrier protein transacylase [Pseudoscourfieldia marina]